MATEVIHTKILEDGSIRVTLDEPHGINQAHRKVVVVLDSTHVFDHDGAIPAGLSDGRDKPYQKGDTVGKMVVFLAGQSQFVVPKGSMSIEFDDGAVRSLVDPAPPEPTASDQPDAALSA